MQYALVSSTCKTTHCNMTLAVERDVKTTNKYKFSSVFFLLCFILDYFNFIYFTPESIFLHFQFYL